MVYVLLITNGTFVYLKLGRHVDSIASIRWQVVYQLIIKWHDISIFDVYVVEMWVEQLSIL